MRKIRGRPGRAAAFGSATVALVLTIVLGSTTLREWLRTSMGYKPGDAVLGLSFTLPALQLSPDDSLG